jgi:hypothetical protein
VSAGTAFCAAPPISASACAARRREGIEKIQGAGVQSGVSIIYVVAYPGELVFVYAISDSDVALCALVLKRKTGVCIDDFHLVTEIAHSDVSFWGATRLGGPTCEIALQPIPEILIFSPQINRLSRFSLQTSANAMPPISHSASWNTSVQTSANYPQI